MSHARRLAALARFAGGAPWQMRDLIAYLRQGAIWRRSNELVGFDPEIRVAAPRTGVHGGSVGARTNR